MPNSATRAIDACAAAAAELEASRVLIQALESENSALRERLETERSTTDLLTELNETRKKETAALRETVAAKNETIAAKDVVIASQNEVNAALKKKKPSLLKRIGDVLLGAAVIAILK